MATNWKIFSVFISYFLVFNWYQMTCNWFCVDIFWALWLVVKHPKEIYYIEKIWISCWIYEHFWSSNLMWVISNILYFEFHSKFKLTAWNAKRLRLKWAIFFVIVLVYLANKKSDIMEYPLRLDVYTYS